MTKYLTGIIHCDDADLALYKTVDVLKETFAHKDGPLIVAYRLRPKPNDEYLIYFLKYCSDD